MYQWHFNKPNTQICKTIPSVNSRICKLHTQISNIHIRIVSSVNISNETVPICQYSQMYFSYERDFM
jgi:hypothetical protein